MKISREIALFMISFLVLVNVVLIVVGVSSGNVPLVLKLLAYLSSGVALVVATIYVVRFFSRPKGKPEVKSEVPSGDKTRIFKLKDFEKIDPFHVVVDGGEGKATIFHDVFAGKKIRKVLDKKGISYVAGTDSIQIFYDKDKGFSKG